MQPILRRYYFWDMSHEWYELLYQNHSSRLKTLSLSLRNVAVFIVELSFQKESHTLLAGWRNRDGSLVDTLSTFIIKHLNSTRCWAGLIVSFLIFFAAFRAFMCRTLIIDLFDWETSNAFDSLKIRSVCFFD